MSDSIFRTVIKTKNNFKTISHTSSIVLFGSCFSENMGKKLAYYKFQQTTNPYGVLFHPLAIEKAIFDCLHLQHYDTSDLILHNERYHSFHHHSDFSKNTEAEIVTAINSTIASTNKKLKEASHLIITLGTAWIYKHVETDTVVANCHKIPQKEFSKELLTVDEITQSLQRIQNGISKINPDLKIIYTVSPVRHVKDGMIENSLSKSHLISAIHRLLKSNAVSYFPAYEIMMDDLRDYRFYAADMIHPNETAITYIWEQFVQAWIATPTELLKKIDNVQKSISHKPFNPDSEAHKKFKEHLKTQIWSLEAQLAISF
ncbi:GSCFA domain-containing protein [Flavicella sediminum]|uniref:GSCFA domain-containing protein n=1 Tax=Flavicella sediminum TaxID=2585141 RepID=UPI001FB7AAF9|nr:GSCFA domain-containing protein [Flavicella sediminum]